MTDYKLIAADYDGTLLPFGKKIPSKRTIDAIIKAKSEGVKFVLSTGRPKKACEQFLALINAEDDAVITQNGAEIYFGEKKVFSETLSEALANEILHAAREKGVTVVCWKSDVLYAERNDAGVEEYKRISGIEPVVVESLEEVNVGGVTKYLWLASEDVAPRYAAEMRGLLGERANAHTSRPQFVEFVPKSVTKANALKFVAERFGIDLKKTLAFGDGENDLEMLLAAGTSVSVENAPLRVKEKVDFVAEACESDGVAKFIEEHLLKSTKIGR